MFDFAINDALKKVWCAPGQDMQTTVKPARLTPRGGAWNHFEIQRVLRRLPELGQRFHVYQIGQLHPALMGLFPKAKTWTTMTEACNRENLIVDLYVNTGVQLPRFNTWYMVTEGKNLIIAVKEQPLIPANLGTDDFFIRLYKNAYFASGRSDAYIDSIITQGTKVLNRDTILALQDTFTTLQAKIGHVYAFVNGIKVSHIDLFSVKLGDIVEYVYDSSIYRIVDFDVNSLGSFVSTMDAKHKYLLHYPGNNTTIDYHDDIDFFVYNPLPNDRHQGVFYHRNKGDAVRMLTHKDYSIVVPYVAGYVQAREDWSLQTAKVRMHIRKSGYLRPLVNESGRIKEIYKLSERDIPRAMLGLDAVVDVWQAAALEASAYTAVMRAPEPTLTRDLVQDCYGYNGISKLAADTPGFARMESFQKVVDVPYGLQQDATGFEYDHAGLLIGWYPHIQGSVYAVRNTQRCALVELLAGQADEYVDEVYGRIDVGVDPTADYRYYLCGISNGLPDNRWVDVTGSGKYDFVNGAVHWLINPAREYPLVRGNKKVLTYGLDLMANEGMMRFSLVHPQYRDQQASNYVMQVPMGELDLFLNGRSLIEDLDYIVKFPQIVIINKEYLINPMTDPQKIVVRFSGFCKKDLTREKCVDHGFIDHGLLSNNNRFDIRDDKVLRIVSDGALYDRSELKFAEADAGVTIPNVRNGRPYLIRDIVVPLRGLVKDSTYVMREKSKIVDKQVSDYMTLKIPNPVFTTPNVIAARYSVFSPFCCKLIFDLKNNIIDMSDMYGYYDEDDLRAKCKPYETLLDFDPTQEGHKLSDAFVIVHPHHLTTVIDLDLHRYTFLQRAITLYLKDAVEINHFVTLSS